MQVRVTESNGQFAVIVSGAIKVAGSRYGFHADLLKSALSDINVIIVVNPRTQLRTTFSITAT
jgi:hypothetical protein